MAKQKQRILTVLGAALGTVLAVFGIRRGLHWYQRKQRLNWLNMQLPQGSGATESGYQSMRQPAREPIPATGPLTEAPPMTGMTTAERVNSDQVYDFDDRGTAFSAAELSNVQADELTGEERHIPGSMIDRDLTGVDVVINPAGENVVPGSQIDRNLSGVNVETDAASGVDDTRFWTESGADQETARQSGMETMPSGQGHSIVMDEYVAPLIEHAIAFNSVMNLLRSRQRDGAGHEGVESLTQGDRSSMRAVLDQMQEHVAQHDETTLRQNPLAQRSYNLTRKLRDALDNLDYTGTDLYRIQDEVRAELCPLAGELDASGQVTITGLEHIRQLYECQ